MLYDNVVKLCKERGITVGYLETKCGFGNATVRSWRDLKYTPRFSSLKAVADFFDVSVEDLMREEEKEKSD